MPIKVTDPDTTSLIAKLLPEFTAYYGADAKIELDFTLQPNKMKDSDGKAFTIDSTKGIIIGNKDDVIIKIVILATNSSAPMTVAAEFNMNFQMVANVTI